MELCSGNPDVVDGAPVVVGDTARLVLKLTETDVVVLISATVVVLVELEDGAVVVLEAATFCVEELDAGVTVTVTVVPVVVIVTRVVLVPVGTPLASVSVMIVELGEAVEVRGDSAESIAEPREASGMVVVTEDEITPVKNVGTAMSLEPPLPVSVSKLSRISINCNSNNRICKSRALSSPFGTVIVVEKLVEIVVDCLFTLSVIWGHTYC